VRSPKIMTEKVAHCENCAIRRYSDKHPNSVVTSIWRWHTGWCPGWKSYQSALESKKGAGTRKNQVQSEPQSEKQGGNQASNPGAFEREGPARKQNNGGQKGGKNQNSGNKPRGKGKKGKGKK